VGYFDNPPNKDPKAIMFASNPAAVTESPFLASSAYSTSGVVATVLLFSALSVVIGFVVGRNAMTRRSEYMVINDNNS
jgi:hypothetical protein